MVARHQTVKAVDELVAGAAEAMQARQGGPFGLLGSLHVIQGGWRGRVRWRDIVVVRRGC